MATPEERIGVCETRLGGLDAGITRHDTDIGTLKKDVAELVKARVWLVTFGSILAALGLGLGFLFKALNDRATKLQDQYTQLEATVKTAQVQAETLQTTLQQAMVTLVGNAKIDLKTAADALAKELPPALHFLEASKYQVVANHGGNINSSHELQDRRILDMTKDGQICDCRDSVPPQARGAIVHVMVGQRVTLNFLPKIQNET
jgi:hypothetical protein